MELCLFMRVFFFPLLFFIWHHFMAFIHHYTFIHVFTMRISIIMNTTLFFTPCQSFLIGDNHLIVLLFSKRTESLSRKSNPEMPAGSSPSVCCLVFTVLCHLVSRNKICLAFEACMGVPINE